MVIKQSFHCRASSLLYSSLLAAKTIIVTTKHVFCRGKSMSMSVPTKLIFVAKNSCWSRQTFCCYKHTFVATKGVFCRDKRFVATSILLSRQKACFVATNVLLLQAYFCRDKRRVLSRQARVYH